MDKIDNVNDYDGFDLESEILESTEEEKKDRVLKMNHTIKPFVIGCGAPWQKDILKILYDRELSIKTDKMILVDSGFSLNDSDIQALRDACNACCISMREAAKAIGQAFSDVSIEPFVNALEKVKLNHEFEPKSKKVTPGNYIHANQKNKKRNYRCLKK